MPFLINARHLITIFAISLLMVTFSTAQEDESLEVTAEAPAPSEIAPTVSDETAAKLIQLHLQARGGIAVINAIQNLTYSGTLKISSDLYKFTFIRIGDDYLYEERSIDKLGRKYTNIRVANPKESWAQETSPKPKRPMVMSKAERESFSFLGVLGTALYQPFLNWEAQGHIFAYDGTANYQGVSTYLIKGKLKNWPIVYYYFDPKTFLIRAVGFRDHFAGQSVNADLVPIRAEKHNGVILETAFEYRVNKKAYQTIEYKRIQLNQKIPLTKFIQPAVRQKQLAP